MNGFKVGAGVTVSRAEVRFALRPNGVLLAAWKANWKAIGRWCGRNSRANPRRNS